MNGGFSMENHTLCCTWTSCMCALNDSWPLIIKHTNGISWPSISSNIPLRNCLMKFKWIFQFSMLLEEEQSISDVNFKNQSLCSVLETKTCLGHLWWHFEAEFHHHNDLKIKILQWKKLRTLMNFAWLCYQKDPR